MTDPTRRRITVVVFDGFEVLDVFGPVEVFAVAGERFAIELAGPDAEPVRSAQGPAVVADVAYRDCAPADIVLVPGGIGTRRLVADATFLAWLRAWAATASIVASVCIGSAVLAAAGLLDGFRATSNKRAFGWVRSQGPGVEWVPQARWVEDRSRWTSSGVSAGIDMALALVSHLHDGELASAIADRIEHDWRDDPRWDPFALKSPPWSSD